MRGDCLRELADCCLCVKTQVPFDVRQTRSGFASGNLNQINLEDLKMQFPNAKATSYNDTVVRQFAIMTIVWGVVGMLVGVIIAAVLLHETVVWTMLASTTVVVLCVAGAKRFA